MNTTKKLFGLFALLAALLFPACDMEYITAPGSGASGDGHSYLTITGLPPNTQALNVSAVFVWNQTGKIAQCEDYDLLVIESSETAASLKIPLAYAAADKIFAETGDYYATFDLNIDALTRIVAAESGKILVHFTGGNGTLDWSEVSRTAVSAPSDGAAHSYLTVTGLPPNTQELDVSAVFVWNQTGKIAECEDYDLLVIESSETAASLKIPLAYSAADKIFGETGDYYVTFDLNIDALTRIVAAESSKVLVRFTAGNGALDYSELLPIPYLVFQGLSRNTAKGNFSGVFVYNAAGTVAKCAGYNDIIVTKTDSSATAKVPLVYNNSSNEYFRDSGTFFVSYTIDTDVLTQFMMTRDDAFPLAFSDGTAVLELSVNRGFFSGGLANPADTNPPVIAGGTKFEINGFDTRITSDTPVKTHSLQRTSLVYIYAEKKFGATEFEYSTTAPVFDSLKNGYYHDGKRALWKLVYIKDTVDRYFAKTYIGDPFTHQYITLSNINLSGLSQTAYSLAGSGNPSPQSITLPAGGYALALTGAGGGGGGGNKGDNLSGGSGGHGGHISEFVIFIGETPLTAFSGQGGGGSGAILWGTDQGAGGGGGGSGTFIYTDGYLLCAGGGGGGSGCGINSGGGAGGAGGSFGSGGGGGKGGSFWLIFSSSSYLYGSAGSSGGQGGGALGGNPTPPENESINITVHGNDAGYGDEHGLFANWGFGGTGGTLSTRTDPRFVVNGGNGGKALFVHDIFIPNGQGADGVNSQTATGHGLPGGTGGNNRNSTRGNGAAGGAGGIPDDGPASAGTKGDDGSLIIYRVF